MSNEVKAVAAAAQADKVSGTPTVFVGKASAKKPALVGKSGFVPTTDQVTQAFDRCAGRVSFPPLPISAPVVAKSDRESERISPRLARPGSNAGVPHASSLSGISEPATKRPWTSRVTRSSAL